MALAIGLLSFNTLVWGQTYSFTTLAGYASQGSADGPATNAQFFAPQGVWADGNGNLFVADSDNHTIREINAGGLVATIAGQAGMSGYADGAGTNALFNLPKNVTGDANGNLYVADTFNEVIRKLTLAGTNWVVSTLAGQAGNAGYAEGTGTNAEFSSPSSVAVDASGNVYVTDQGNDLIRKITPAGEVSSIAGQLGQTQNLDGTNQDAWFDRPIGIATDSSNNLYVTDSDYTIRWLQPAGTNWVVMTIAGQANHFGSMDGLGTNASFSAPDGIAVDAMTNIYVADSFNETIRKLTFLGTNWMVSTLAGLAGAQGFADGTNTTARFSLPAGVALDASGNIVVADVNNNNLRLITQAGTNSVVTTLAGVGPGSADGPGSVARFWLTTGVAVDKAGTLYVADFENETIRRITTNDVVSTIAGLAGSSGSADGTNADARFHGPFDVAVDSQGNLYVTDTYNNAIRKVAPAGTNWVVTTLAGNPGLPPAEHDGTETNAFFDSPACIAVDAGTNLYVTDSSGQTIREVSLVNTNWVVTTIAGVPFTFGYSNALGTNALFLYPHGIVVDAATNLYVADTENNVIRKLTPTGTHWAVTTIAGNPGVSGGTDGTGTNAQFYFPEGIALDHAGNLFIADSFNNTVRRLMPMGTNWTSTTLGGQVQITGSADGLGTNALFDIPESIAVDGRDDLYVADAENNSIRFGQAIFTVPELQISQAGGQVLLSWPAAGNFSLQTNSDLTTANWALFGGAVSSVNGTNNVVLVPSLNQLFFRLAGP